jgi:hypothetical protein
MPALVLFVVALVADVIPLCQFISFCRLSCHVGSALQLGRNCVMSGLIFVHSAKAIGGILLLRHTKF